MLNMPFGRKKTMKEKTLDLLIACGDDGVHSFIGARKVSHRFAAYVGFLRNDGFNIISKREKMGSAWGVRYYLIENCFSWE